jgi:hypothetical protein
MIMHVNPPVAKLVHHKHHLSSMSGRYYVSRSSWAAYPCQAAQKAACVTINRLLCKCSICSNRSVWPVLGLVQLHYGLDYGMKL